MIKKCIKGHKYIIVHTKAQRKKNRDLFHLKAIGGKAAHARGTPGAFGGRSKKRKNPFCGLVGADKPYGGRYTLATDKHVKFLNEPVLPKR